MATHDPDFPDAGASADKAEPGRRGCLFYGLVGMTVVSVAVMLAMALTALVGYRTIMRYRDMYTSDAPVELPKLTTSEKERKRAVARALAFRDAVEAGRAVDPLVLSGDDVNALIQESPRLRNHLHLAIDDDRVRAKLSLPLSELQDFSLTRGRYLNGEAVVKVELDDGRLEVEVVSMLAEGKELPPVVCDLLTRWNVVLDDDEHEDDAPRPAGKSRFARFLKRIKSLEVDDGEVVVKPRSPD